MRNIKVIVLVCFACISLAANSKTIKVCTRDIYQVEEIIRSDGNSYTMTFRNGTVYRLENKKQYDLILANWSEYKFLDIDIISDEKE